MPDKNHHLSGEEILLTAEGELPPHRADDVQNHLSTCEGCRLRMLKLRNTISGVIGLHHQGVDPLLPAAGVARARLKVRLAEASSNSRLGAWTRFFRLPLGGHGLAYISAGIIVVALGMWTVHYRGARLEYESAVENPGKFETPPVPNPNLTPGAIRPVTLEDVCTKQPNVGARAISISEQRRVFQEYGIADARPENYELDYLITPELGGSDDIRNLWPEPHTTTLWNSYVKDDLENHLHQLVCGGKVDLATAQHDIATDWISAYKKYFQTDRPIAIHPDQNPDERRRPRA